MTSIVVLESGRHPFLRSIADAITDALREEGPPAPSVEPAPRIALPEGEPGHDPEGADAVLALDAPSLARAVELRVPMRAAWIGWLDPEWDEVIAKADVVWVAHRALVEAVIAMGAPRARVRVGPMISARRDRMDRAAARTALGIAPETPVVIVPSAVIGDDLTGMLVQLALARDGIRFLFDVGLDVQAAESLRRRAAFPAHMFADGPIANEAWMAADRALARIDGPELLRALAHEVAPILAPAGGGAALVARALAQSGIATVAASEVTLAVAIDEACAPRAIDASRAALRALDAETGAQRLIAMVRAAIEERALARVPEGLPRGLEAIGPDAAASIRPDGSPKHDGAPRPAGEREDAIERELQALRERIAKG